MPARIGTFGFARHTEPTLRKTKRANFPTAQKNYAIIFVCTNKMFIFVPEMEKCNSRYCGCLYYSANALSRLMTKMADEEFAITGLSTSYAFLLMTVNNKPGIQPKEISEQMQLTPSTITRLIEKMEQKKLLRRKSTGRTTEVYPTDKSKEMDKKIKEAWRNLYHRYSELIGETKAKKLTTDIYDAVNKLE